MIQSFVEFSALSEGIRRSDNDTDLGGMVSAMIGADILKLNGVKGVGYSDGYSDNTEVTISIELDGEYKDIAVSKNSSLARKLVSFKEKPATIISNILKLAKTIDGGASIGDKDVPAKKQEYMDSDSKANGNKGESYYVSNSMSFTLYIPLN